MVSMGGVFDAWTATFFRIGCGYTKSATATDPAAANCGT
jgi:hypothetical protein